MGILIDTVMGELAVVCIVDKDDLGELYGSIFVKKQVLEPLRAESRPVPLARRRTPPLLAPARRTCWAARCRARCRNLSKLVGHSGGSQVGCARVPGTTGGMCDFHGQLPSIGYT